MVPPENDGIGTAERFGLAATIYRNRDGRDILRWIRPGELSKD
jgi:hypothetical protein